MASQPGGGSLRGRQGLVQMDEDGEDTAVVVRSRLQLQLGEDDGDHALDRLDGHVEALGDGAVGSPLRHEGQDACAPGS